MSGPRRFVERLIVTAALAVLAYALATTPLPGIERARFDAAHLTDLSLVGAGLVPLVATFVLLHLARGLDPRAAQRSRRLLPLFAAAGGLPLGWLAHVQLMRSTADDALVPPAAALALGCAAGSALLTGLGWAATRFGLGNGYLVVTLAATLGLSADDGAGLAATAARARALPGAHDPAGEASLLPTIAAGVGLAALFLGLLRGRRRLTVEGFPRPVSFPLLPAGLAGLALGPTLVLVVLRGVYEGALLQLEHDVSVRPALFDGWLLTFLSPAAEGLLAVAATTVFTIFFAAVSCDLRPLARHGAAPGEAEGRALLLERPLRLLAWCNVAVAVLVVAVDGFVVHATLDLTFAAWLGIALAALLLDGWDELRAPPDLVALGEAPRLFEADRMRDALAAAGIPCLVRRLHGWQPLGVLAAFVPLELSVARADVERARAVLEAEAPFLVGSPALDPPPETPELATGSPPPGAASPA